jgi:hypothetical protein
MGNRLGPFRGALAIALVLTLGAATGCKHKQTPAQQESGSGVRSLGQSRAATDTSYLPQDVFGPEAVPMARRIPAGARLRLTIAPLNSPGYQKNYNTGGRIGYEKLEDARIAYIKG